MNTFHIFLPDLANIIIPLNGLLNKEKTMNDRNDACDEAFVKAKESLIKIVMLVYPNSTLEYKIYANASGNALGGMLAQTYEVQISRMPMVTNDTKLIPQHDWLEVKTGNLPDIIVL